MNSTKLWRVGILALLVATSYGCATDLKPDVYGTAGLYQAYDRFGRQVPGRVQVDWVYLRDLRNKLDVCNKVIFPEYQEPAKGKPIGEFKLTDPNSEWDHGMDRR